jgi:hypothetical protein
MNYETFTQFLAEFSAQTDLMDIGEYINFLYKKVGLDGLMSVLRLQQYTVSHLHSDNRILRMNYLDNNRIWRPRWSRQTRGTIFWLNDDDVWVPIKFLLERGAEVFTGFHVKNGVTETDNFSIENIACKTARIPVLDDAQQKLIECLITNSEIPDGLVASFKKDGSLLGCTMYKDKNIQDYMRELIIKIGDKFALQVMQFCDQLNIPLLSFSTQSTLLVGEFMQDYTVTALLSTVMSDIEIAKYSDKTYLEVFAMFGKPVISMLYELIKNASFKLNSNDLDTITLSMESICKDRTTVFNGAIVHKELALSYDESSLTVLGISFSNSSDVTYNPHYEFSEQIYTVGLKEPSFWVVNHTEQINSLIQSIDNVIKGQITIKEFYETHPPSNKFHFEQIIDYEGFVTYSMKRNEYGSLNYNKIKTDAYYKMHKPRKEYMSFIIEMAQYPEVQNVYPICVVARNFYSNLESLNAIHLKFMQTHTSLDSPLFLSLNEKAQKSFHTQQQKVQLKMLINSPGGFQKVSIELFKEFYPFHEDKVETDVLDEIGSVMKSIFMKSLDGIKLDELKSSGIIDELFVLVQKLK